MYIFIQTATPILSRSASKHDLLCNIWSILFTVRYLIKFCTSSNTFFSSVSVQHTLRDPLSVVYVHLWLWTFYLWMSSLPCFTLHCLLLTSRRASQKVSCYFICCRWKYRWYAKYFSVFFCVIVIIFLLCTKKDNIERKKEILG